MSRLPAQNLKHATNMVVYFGDAAADEVVTI